MENKNKNTRTLVVEGEPVVTARTAEAPEAENKKKGCLWPILIVILVALVFLLGRCSSSVVHTTDGECAHCTIHCPECAHSETNVEESAWTWTKVSEKGICRKGERIVKTICTECEAIVSEETESKTDTEHNFEGNSCKDCDYKKKSQSSNSGNTGTQKPVDSSCKHAETKTETSEWKWTEVGTESTCQKASRTVKKVCSDCGKTISTETENTTDGEHNFVDGKCKDCGFTKAPAECSHKSTKTETSEWKWTAVGTESTCQKASRTVTTVCKDCNKTIDTDTESKTDDTHSFNGRTCTACGYKKPLLEEGYVDIKGEIDAPNNSWDYVDDGEPAKPVE